MHKGHFAGCALALVFALGFLAFTGGSAGGIGVLIAVLACPITMILAMRFLMGGHDTNHHGTVDRPVPEREPV